jgi:hypothetical protein
MAMLAQSIERLLRNPVSEQTGQIRQSLSCQAPVKVVPQASGMNHASFLNGVYRYAD